MKPPQHTIRNCVAFGNRAAGFYANHHPVGDFWYNDTGFDNNSANFNMLGYANGAAMNVGILRNDVAFMRTLIANGSGGQVDDQFDSWDAPLGITVSTADFQSTSTTGWDGPRQADGSLPVLSSLHLQTGSALIDRGTDVGLPFNGAAPDLGAFESGPPLVVTDAGAGGTMNSSGGSTASSGGGVASSAGGAPSGAPGMGGSGALGAGGFDTAAGGAVGSGASSAAPAGGAAGLAGSPSNGGATSTSGAGASESSGEPEASNASSSGGCSCRVTPRSGGSAYVAAWLALFWVVRRRQRT
jgi:MYXO-CTERM domain-containing protein